MRVFHFAPAKWGLENISKRRLKIATLNELNDPFELLCLSMDDGSVQFLLAAVKEELAKDEGLLCFSEEWSNPVQWSHYAEGHKGICLGFDVPDSMLMRVDYSSTRLASHTFFKSRQVLEESMRRSLSTKFSDWAYERERRVWVKLDHSLAECGRYFEGFSDKLSLREVTLGFVSQITATDIRSALGRDLSEIEIYRAHLSAKSFQMERKLEGF